MINLYKSVAEIIRPLEKITVSEYAQRYVYNPSNSADPGKFDLNRAYYQKEIMDALTPNNGVEKIVFMSGAQLGKTFCATVWLNYIFDQNPQNIICYQPTITLAQTFSNTKVDAMIASNPRIKDIFSNKKERNNMNVKTFKGNTINFFGANSGNSFRMISSPYIFADEIDSWQSDIDEEGDPIQLMMNRTNTFGSKKKVFMASTPTITDLSAIEREFLSGDQNYYHVPCPHCGALQTLIFYNLKFERYKDTNKVIPESIYYECQICKGHIEEHHKTKMLMTGKWIPENPNAPKSIKSFQLNSLYSPIGWLSWSSIVQKFLDAKDDPLLIKVFKNTILGLTYAEKSQQPSFEKLIERAEKYDSKTVNGQVVVLFGAVDVQDNRLATTIIGYGKDGEMFVVDYQEIVGSPGEPLVWEAMQRIMERPYKHEAGIDMNIKAIAIDSGGHFTSTVYDFCRKNQLKYFPIKGASSDFNGYIKKANSIDRDIKTGKKYDKELDLYLVNVHLIKKILYINLNNMLINDKREGSNVVHFPCDLQRQYYQMLVSEKLVKKIVAGRYKEEFIKTKDSTRNEALDVTVYCMALAYMFQVQGLYGSTYDKLYELNVGRKIEKEEVIKEKTTQAIRKPKSPWINKGSNWKLK